jgi:signal transduction histidine kinase
VTSPAASLDLDHERRGAGAVTVRFVAPGGRARRCGAAQDAPRGDDRALLVVWLGYARGVKFLDELRAYLERPEASQPVYVPDVAAHRRHLLDGLAKLEEQGRDKKAIRKLYNRWDDDRLKRFAAGMAHLLAGGLGRGEPSGEIERFINIALDWDLRLDASTGSYAKDMELDRLRGHIELQEGGEPEAQQYALAVRAVRRAGSSRSVTLLGKLIVDLPDRDALRWMLANEVVQSHGEGDKWRLSRSGATYLLNVPGWTGDWYTNDPWPAPWEVLHRLSRMNILKVTEDNEREATTYALLAEGRPLLEEVASDKDTPFILLARAFLQDETAAVLGQYPVAAALVRQENAATIATRHARLVAHEVRNALVPVRVTLRELYGEIEARGQAEVLVKRRDRIDGGIARIFRFARDAVQGTSVAVEPTGVFTLAPAIESAVAAVGPEIERDVPFVQEAELPPVLGHRDRFVLALVNILRNAAQMREHPAVQIQITAGVKNGAEVFVRVDDDGPGVAAEDRTVIFDAGFSRRPGGSGHGLALVREVVEAEMAGRVTCEESPMGGARFVVRLPVGNKRIA